MKKEVSGKEIEKAMPGKHYPLISGIIIVLLVALIVFLLLRNNDGAGPDNGFKGDKVKVEFYVMSQCPYGVQVETGIAPVLEQMGDGIDFQLNYIAKETAPGVFQSLHGDKEVKGNIVQLCARSYYPDEYFNFITCQNKDVQNVDTNWLTCAQESGMDSEKLKKCLESDEGVGLLRTSLQRTMARGATGSPTIYINDVQYQGQRDSLSFQRAICKYSKHPACAEIPKCGSDEDCTEQAGKEGYCINPGESNSECQYKDPVVVEYIILNDKACTACDTTNIVQVSQQLFLGGKPRLVDISTEEGKALVKQYSVEVVPAYIFDASVTQTKSWTTIPDLAGVFDKLSDGKYKLKDEVTGAAYFVSEDARKAYYDAIGVKKRDNKPQIDFFVMSYCPYGNQAEEGIEPAYQLLKDKAIFKPHYVIYENYQGGGDNYCIDSGKLCSMHGIQELNQNVREACVNKYMGIGKWFEFALAMNDKCTSQNADSCWEAVAKELKLDVAKIKDCQAKEAVALMAADKALGDKLKVSGSPTVFVDGDSYNGGRTPEAYKTGLCAAYETAPAECSTTLAGATASTAAAAPAAGSC
jgi:predicted DsbA family dithiol-disulfide isomerase